jgi:hypothetical protein
MKSCERVPDLWDMQLLHDHISRILEFVSGPDEDEGFSWLWAKDDFEIVHLIAHELSSDDEMVKPPLERKPRGWPPTVCDALSTLANLTEEFSKPWRWRPTKGKWASQRLVLGKSVIDALMWTNQVLAEAVAEASLDEEENDRDTFVIRRRAEGIPRKKIRAMVNERAASNGWNRLKSDQAISQIVHRSKTFISQNDHSYK